MPRTCVLLCALIACAPPQEPLVADTTAALTACAPLFAPELGDDLTTAARLDADAVAAACALGRTLYDRHADEVGRSRQHGHLVADAARLGDDLDFTLRSIGQNPAAVPIGVGHVREALRAATTTRDAWSTPPDPYDEPRSASDWGRALEGDALETDAGMSFLRRYAFEQDVDPDQVRRRLLTVHGARERVVLAQRVRALEHAPAELRAPLSAWLDGATGWADTYDRIVAAYVSGRVRTHEEAAAHVAAAGEAHTQWRTGWLAAAAVLKVEPPAAP